MATAFDLRPLNFGDHLSRGFALFLRRWVRIAQWYALTFLLPMTLVVLAMHVLIQPYDWMAAHQAEPSVLAASKYSAYYWLLRLISLAFSQWLAAAGVLYMTSRMYVGDEPGLAETARAVFKRAGHLTGTTLVHLLALSAILLVTFGPALLMAESGRRSDVVWAWVVGVCCSAPAAMVLALLYLGRFGLNLPCVMLDDADAASAFTRSAMLTKGLRLRLGMLFLVLMFLTGVPGLWFLLDVPGAVGRALLHSASWPLAGDLLSVAWQGLLGPVLWLPIVAYYFDQRSRKEGYDLAVMARNFGIEEADLLRHSMNSDLGYTPKGFTGQRGVRPLPVAQPVMAGAPQFSQRPPWPQPAVQAARPRVFRPPPRRGMP
ncbi:MAG: hypothetical protein KF754_06775 [Planctomycetes bacterium]|nr:hypothetical protein [Planctomycetota bacterium]